MQQSMRFPFAVLCAVPFIMVLGNSMLVPLLPEMKAQMHLTLAHVGLIITAFSLPAGITIPIAGFLSDRWGRKAIMVPALILYGLGGLIAGLAAWLLEQPFSWLIGGRIVQGIGAGGTYQLAMALTGDIFQSHERTRALGLLETSNGLGKVVSPIAGSALGLLIWFAPFFAYGLLAIPVALAVAWVVGEPAPNGTERYHPDVKTYLRSVGSIFRAKGASLLTCFLAGGVALFILFGVLSYLADILRLRWGITGLASGFLIAIPVSVMAVTSYLAGNYLEKREVVLKETIITGLALIAGALIAIGLVTNIYLFFIALGMMGLGTGSVLPAVNTLITGAAAREERGIITCIYGAMRFFGVALGPPAFGLVTSIGRLPFFGLAALFVGGLALLAMALLQENVLLPPRTAPES